MPFRILRRAVLLHRVSPDALEQTLAQLVDIALAGLARGRYHVAFVDIFVPFYRRDTVFSSTAFVHRSCASVFAWQRRLRKAGRASEAAHEWLQRKERFLHCICHWFGQPQKGLRTLTRFSADLHALMGAATWRTFSLYLGGCPALGKRTWTLGTLIRQEIALLDRNSPQKVFGTQTT